MASAPRGRSVSVNPTANDDELEPGESESEWEWEYHETETESFYITLDLPAPPSRSRTKATKLDPKGDKSEQSKTPATDTNTSAHPTPGPGSAGVELEPVGADLVGVSALPSVKRIQILDLHSENPIISYQNQYYGCQWTSTLGTDLLLVSPDLDSSHPVLYREEAFDVLAATGIKIVGQPLQIVPRPEVRGKHRASPTIGASTEQNEVRVEDDGEPDIPGVANAPLALHGVIAPRGTQIESDGSIRIPLRPEEGRTRHSQARFLERLIASKNAKGDPDLVPVYAKKKFTGSSWRSWQKGEDAIMGNGTVEQEHGDSESDEEFDSTEAGPKPTSKASRRARARTRGAGRGRSRGRSGRQQQVSDSRGLFADHQPALNGAGDAQIEAISDHTPQTWNDVEMVEPPPPDHERTHTGRGAQEVRTEDEDAAMDEA